MRTSARTFAISRLRLDTRGTFFLESVIDSWGEDDRVLAEFAAGTPIEPQTLNLWAFLTMGAPAGALLIDVGAYTGLFSLLAATLRADVRPIAFEPSAITFGRLARNIILNQREVGILPVNLAAWHTKELLLFPHQYGIYSMSPGEMVQGAQIDHTQHVLGVPLDVLLNDPNALPDYLNTRCMPLAPVRSISAIKIDVEGHEGAVLSGAGRLLDRHRPSVICEAWDAAAAAALAEIFRSHDYVGGETWLDGNQWFRPSEKSTALLDGYRSWCGTWGADLVLQLERVLTWTL
jgi:FkbM family methyltransferase